MKLDIGDVAGLATGLATTKIVEKAGKQALREEGLDKDLVSNLLVLGGSLAVGGLVGSTVDSVFDGLFGD